MSRGGSGTGSCLCGAVRFIAKNKGTSVGACHCQICTKWSGGPLFGVDCGCDVFFEGNENISVFSSSAWAERGFCKNCGSHLFYKLKENNQFFIPPGLFQNSESLVFDHQMFIEEKPSFYHFANETKNMTGEEVFAQFSEK